MARDGLVQQAAGDNEADTAAAAELSQIVPRLLQGLTAMLPRQGFLFAVTRGQRCMQRVTFAGSYATAPHLAQTL